MQQSRRERRTRLVTFAAVAVASLTAFVALGGAELAQSAISLVQYQYGKKVTICHKGKQTITISVRAWPAHKRHGDSEGACVLAKRGKAKHVPAKKGSAGGAETEAPSTQVGGGTTAHGNASAAHGNAGGNGSAGANGKGNGKGHS